MGNLDFSNPVIMSDHFLLSDGNMRYIKKLAINLLVEEDGPTAVEYAVMLAVIIIASIGAVLSTGDVQEAMFSDTADQMNQSMFPSN